MRTGRWRAKWRQHGRPATPASLHAENDGFLAATPPAAASPGQRQPPPATLPCLAPARCCRHALQVSRLTSWNTYRVGGKSSPFWKLNPPRGAVSVGMRPSMRSVAAPPLQAR